MIITIDGPGGSGKSTAARLLARRLGLPYLNSGYIYRAVTLLVLEEGVEFADRERVAALIRGMRLRFVEEEARTRVFVTSGQAPEREVTGRLKDPDVTPNVFRVASDGFYRSLLVDLQRRAAEPDGVVAEGRDMGSVIFPAADVKFYVDASPEERARRQLRDLQAKGHATTYAEILEQVIERDHHDRDRAVAPLVVPAGARSICTDTLAVEDVVQLMVREVEARGKARVPAAGGAP